MHTLNITHNSDCNVHIWRSKVKSQQRDGKSQELTFCCKNSAARTRTEFARQAFSVAAPHTWNSLSSDTGSCDTVHSFKNTSKHTLTYSHQRLWIIYRTLRCYINTVLLLLPIRTVGWWRWSLVSPDGVVRSRMVSVSASVDLLLHHTVQKFSSGTGSPGWSWKKGHKTVVVLLIRR